MNYLPGKGKPEIKAQGSGNLHNEQPLPLYKFYCEILRAATQLLEEPFFHHRRDRHDEALLNLLGEGIASPAGQAKWPRTCWNISAQAAGIPGGNRQQLQPRSHSGRRHLYRLAILDHRLLGDCHFANGRGRQVKDPFVHQLQPPAGLITATIFLKCWILQDSLQEKYTAACALHFFLGETQHDRLW
jgi:hypothetical protein